MVPDVILDRKLGWISEQKLGWFVLLFWLIACVAGGLENKNLRNNKVEWLSILVTKD